MRENKQKGKDQLKLLSVQNTPPPIPRPTNIKTIFFFNRNLHVSSFMYLSTLLEPKSVSFLYCSLLIFNFINVHVVC